MLKKIQKKKKKVIDPLDEVVLESVFDKFPSPQHDDNLGFPSPSMSSPLKSNFEETGGPGGSVKISYMDTTTTQGDNYQISTPEKTIVTPPEVPISNQVLRRFGLQVSLRTYLIWTQMSIWVKEC